MIPVEIFYRNWHTLYIVVLHILCTGVDITSDTFIILVVFVSILYSYRKRIYVYVHSHAVLELLFKSDKKKQTSKKEKRKIIGHTGCVSV